MTTNTSQAAADALTWLSSDKALDLIVRPVDRLAVTAQVARTRLTAAHQLRVPIVLADPQAQWVAEGEEVPLSSTQLGEQVIGFNKLAGLTVITRELANDTDPSVLNEIGAGLARDIARQIDNAFFGSNEEDANAPAGLEDLENITEIEATTLEDLDVFTEARFAAAQHDATVGAFVAHPTTAQRIAVLKEGSTSARNLLASVPEGDNSGIVASIDGIALRTSTAVTEGTIWAIPNDRVILGIREDVNIQVFDQVFFSSDRIAIRATMRAAFGFLDEGSIVKVTVPAAE